MKILIVGTGVIGSLYGKALSEKHDVTHFVRENKFEALNNKTIPYDIIDERNTDDLIYTKGDYTYKCTASTCDNYDLVIVPVNSYQLDSVLNTLSKGNSNNKYLIFTLNWNGTKDIDKYISKNNYIMGYPGGGGTFNDNLLYGNIGEDIALGSISKDSDSLLNLTNEIFKSCSFVPEIHDNILHYLWIHNVSTVPVWAGVSKYDNIDDFFNDKELFEKTYYATKECFEICRKRGVDIDSLPEVQLYKMDCNTIYEMMKTNFRTNPVMKRYTAHALKSFKEMKFNFSQIYQTGLDLKVDMKNMTFLKSLIL